MSSSTTQTTPTVVTPSDAYHRFVATAAPKVKADFEYETAQLISGLKAAGRDDLIQIFEQGTYLDFLLALEKEVKCDSPPSDDLRALATVYGHSDSL